MEDGPAILAATSKSLQELAMEGQKALEATVEAAHETLASMNEVLCNPALWSTSSSLSMAANATPATVALSSSSAGAGALSTVDTTDNAGSRIDAIKIGADGLAQQEAGWAALEEARARLRSSATSLRAVITATFTSPQMREQEDPSNSLSDNSDPVEVEKLEQQVSVLREEVKNKNKVVKVLIDQFRELINDISMWQSPGL